MASVGPSRIRSKPQGDEEPEIINRVTKSGRKLQYELKVMQQPERARACGSGAKSSADRRPVDPPPVVELKVFQVNSDGSKHDITFAYNANFFLFATLEQARPIANGRVSAPTTPQNPVLTGMPVSGMAYLDRPSEAGYFIFQDLAVRHEGTYRLSFNLYEQTNKPEEDGDQEPALDGKPKVSMDSAQDPESSFDWRMELKSKPFVVFSAKKFPGLAESTHLSRICAEQGCRVRIRRDVRMRKRTDGKADSDFVQAQEEYTRGRALEEQSQRERSRSNSPYGSGSEGGSPRSGSGEFQPAPPGGHLGFGGPQAAQQFSMPHQLPQQPQQPHHQHPGYPPHSQYGPAPLPASQGQYAPYPQSAYPSYPANRDQWQEDPLRRQSMAGHQHEQFPGHPPPAQESFFGRNPQPFQQGYPASSPPQGTKLPPLNIKMDVDRAPAVALPPASRLASIVSTVHSPVHGRKDERRPSQYPDYSEPLIPAAIPAPETPRNGNKRAYEDTFRSDSYSQPLRNGQRPPSLDDDIDADDSDEDEPPTMSYKRAGGYVQHRVLPDTL